jgi:Protein of unknown function (DUF4238)
MATNKNQHYVPKVHLKPFTLEGEGRAINLFNLDKLSSVENAPVKNQCSGNYFYGENAKLERAINTVESAYGKVVRHLADGGAIDEMVNVVLRRFIYLQYVRTEAAARKANEMISIITDRSRAYEPTSSVREAVKNAVQQAMLEYADSMKIVDDLTLCIIRNRTDIPFVTSDDPAVLTNRLHFQRGTTGKRSFGISTAGVLFILPLTPFLCAILHDGDVYSVNQYTSCVDIVSTADAEALNQHQYLNCMANIYFGGWDDRLRVLAAAKSALLDRPESKQSVTYAVLDKTTECGKRYAIRSESEIGDGEKVLVHVTANHPKPNSWPSFLLFRPDAEAWSNDTGAGLTRRGCLEMGFEKGDDYRKIRIFNI